LLGWIYLAIEMFATATVKLIDHRPEPVPRWLTWLTIAGAEQCPSRRARPFFKRASRVSGALIACVVPVS
jgi:hypothetical protein